MQHFIFVVHDHFVTLSLHCFYQDPYTRTETLLDLMFQAYVFCAMRSNEFYVI